MVINLELKAPNNNLHADCHKRHGFCKEKELQKPRHLWQQVKLALFSCFLEQKVKRNLLLKERKLSAVN